MRRPLRIDGHEPPAGQRDHGRLECPRVLVHLAGVVLAPVEGNGPAGLEKFPDEGIAEEGGRGEVVHLALHHRAHEERIDEVVRVVDAEEDGAGPGDALGMPHVDGAEEEPDPEAAKEPHEGIEAVPLLHQRPRKRVNVAWKRPACSMTDRKSTRLNSSHGYISYAVFCLKKKKRKKK